jgi:hypothetical protein
MLTTIARVTTLVVGCYVSYRVGVDIGKEQLADDLVNTVKESTDSICEQFDDLIAKAEEEIQELSLEIIRIDNNEGAYTNLKGAARDACYDNLQTKINSKKSYITNMKKNRELLGNPS